jgi:hypothetical protein
MTMASERKIAATKLALLGPLPPLGPGFLLQHG